MHFFFSWQELISATNGCWCGLDPDTLDSRGISAVDTDSRSLSRNALFIALPGDRFDGHNFVIEATINGASAVCVSHLSNEELSLLTQRKIPCLKVDNTLAGYQKLARYHRMRCKNLIVIGITGSSGKTSTKDIIGAVLREHFSGDVLITKGNTNNQVGVPLNLLNLGDNHRAAALELGTNSPGEIKMLTDLIVPDYAVLTNVGPVHLEGLQNIEGVIEEKSTIFSSLSESGGAAVIPYVLRNHPKVQAALANTKFITFGFEENADIRVSYKSGNIEHSRFKLQQRGRPNTIDVKWDLPGPHLTLNAGAAFAVAKLMNIGDDTVVKALTNCQLADMRMQIEWRNDIRWINDAYNANPDSMMAFVNWLGTVALNECETGGATYLVLGDMLELGASEDQYHQDVICKVLSVISTMTILPVGERMSRAASHYNLSAFKDAEAVSEWLVKRVKSGDTIALKGSRGMALEKIVQCSPLQK
jgi:UDP-N-acetylmuramoyl-tripeptide--D-alanyl-D-alanine ligase